MRFIAVCALTLLWSPCSDSASVSLSEAASPGDNRGGVHYGENHLRSADAQDPRRMKPPVSLQEIRSMSGNSMKGTGATNMPAAVIGGNNPQTQVDSKRQGQLKSVKTEMSSLFKGSSYARRTTDMTDAIINMELSPVEGDPERELEDMTGNPEADGDGSVEAQAPPPPQLNPNDPNFQNQMAQLSQLAAFASNPAVMQALKQAGMPQMGQGMPQLGQNGVQMPQMQMPQMQMPQAMPQLPQQQLPPMQMPQMGMPQQTPPMAQPQMPQQMQQQQAPQMPQMQMPQMQQQQMPQMQQQQVPQQQMQQTAPPPQLAPSAHANVLPPMQLNTQGHTSGAPDTSAPAYNTVENTQPTPATQ